MANEIQNVRDEIERGLVSARVVPEERLVELSPCGRYELELNAYSTESLPSYPSIAVAIIRSVETGEIVATVKRSDDRYFYCWITSNGHDYLLFPEDLEGQTVVDLSSRRVEGFYSPDDPFIWAEYHPSPDKTRLAIVGCYWSCPYLIRVYDFREPMNLPLPIIVDIVLSGPDANFGEWTSADSFTILDQDGGFRVFELSPIESG